MFQPNYRYDIVAGGDRGGNSFVGQILLHICPIAIKFNLLEAAPVHVESQQGFNHIISPLIILN